MNKTLRPSFIAALDDDFELVMKKRDEFPQLASDYDFLDRLVLKVELAETYELLELNAKAVSTQLGKMKTKTRGQNESV